MWVCIISCKQTIWVAKLTVVFCNKWTILNNPNYTILLHITFSIILEWPDLSLDSQNQGKKTKDAKNKGKDKIPEKSIADQTVQAALQFGVLVRFLPNLYLEHNIFHTYLKI